MEAKVMKVPVSQGNYALVDADDYEELSKYSWQIDHGYARGNKYIGKINGKYVSKRFWMHRVIMNTPAGMQTDHINGDRLDNRRSNLRVCTSQQNNRNRHLSVNNTSGVAGVIYRANRGKWQAAITIDYKRHSLGHFLTKEEAVKARIDAVNKHFKEFAHN